MSDRMTNRDEEVFAPYDDFFDGDEWPSIQTGGQLVTTWVGDMAPQHCSSAIHKLKRWAFGQWADETRNESGWAEIQSTILYKHLAAKATGGDFVDAIAKPLPSTTRLKDREALHALAEAVERAIEIDRVEAYELAALMYMHLTKNDYRIVKER